MRVTATLLLMGLLLVFAGAAQAATIDPATGRPFDPPSGIAPETVRTILGHFAAQLAQIGAAHVVMADLFPDRGSGDHRGGRRSEKTRKGKRADQ